MRARNNGILWWVVGNPIYVVSAAVMMYGVSVLLNHEPHRAGDVAHILTTYLMLQVYELTLIVLAAWILLKLLVRDDGATLLALECLVFGVAFITLDELLAANLAIGMTVASITSQTATASAVLVVACIGAAAAHLFSLHHSFLAPAHLFYIAPVCVSVLMAVVWAIHLSGRANRVAFFVVAILPFAALVCFTVDRAGMAAGGGGVSALAMTRFAMVAIFVCLLVMTGRTSLVVHVLIAFLLAIEPQRHRAADEIAEHVSAHEGWYLVALAFALFVPGILLSYYKSAKCDSAPLDE